MATWKKVIVSGSGVSQLSNDANFLAKASLMNLDGKILFENDYFESKGRHEFKIHNLISGVYILQLYEGGVWKSTKVLIGH